MDAELIKHEIVKEKLSIDHPADPMGVIEDTNFDKLPADIKQEPSMCEELSFAVKIPKVELLPKEIPIKEELSEEEIHLKPLPTEKIYVKDEFILQPFFNNDLKGISRLGGSYVCDVCHYQSMDVMKLKTHVVLHIKEKPFKCFECTHEFFSKFDVTLHILNQHGEIFRCSQCRYTAMTRNDMEQHMMIHSVEEEEHMKILAAEKPFKCNHCEYRAAKEYFLEKHMIKHSPENCFKCKQCSFTTVLKSKLREHVKSHRKRKRTST